MAFKTYIDQYRMHLLILVFNYIFEILESSLIRLALIRVLDRFAIFINSTLKKTEVSTFVLELHYHCFDVAFKMLQERTWIILVGLIQRNKISNTRLSQHILITILITYSRY